jgi:hypothetical protein
VVGRRACGEQGGADGTGGQHARQPVSDSARVDDPVGLGGMHGPGSKTLAEHAPCCGLLRPTCVVETSLDINLLLLCAAGMMQRRGLQQRPKTQCY